MTLRIGYVPYSADLSAPADRRRLPFWAAHRGVPYEIVRPGVHYDVIVLAGTADVTQWAHHPMDGSKIVYELIDSYLALPRRSPKSLLRGMAKFAARETARPVLDYHRAIEAMCRRADAVVCSTPEQRADLLPLCPEVHVILDAHLDLATKVKKDFTLEQPVHLVWEGQAHTVDDFLTIAPVLERISARRPLALHLVTDIEYRKYARRFVRRHTGDLARHILPETYLYQWNSHLLADVVTACDLALIPLDLDDSFARGKPENKLLLLWRLGMPVVTSASPAYRRVMAEAGLDLTCTTADEWEETLERVLDDEHLRVDAAAKGLGYVERCHDLESVLDRWDRLFGRLV